MVNKESTAGTNVSRRNFLGTFGTAGVLAASASVGFSESALASSEKVQGRIQKANNKPAKENRVDVVGKGGFIHEMTNRGGRFEFDSKGFIQPLLGYYGTEGDSLRITSIKDGSPDMFTFPRRNLEDSQFNLGNIKLPEAHLLHVKVQDENSNPVTNVRVRFIHYQGLSGFGTGRRLVNDEGMFQYAAANEPGIELVGDVRAEVWASDSDFQDGPMMYRRFVLTEDRTETFTIS